MTNRPEKKLVQVREKQQLKPMESDIWEARKCVEVIE